MTPETNIPHKGSDGTKGQNESLIDTKGFLEELQEESPRAAAIMAGALLDAQLRNLLEKYFVDDRKIVNDLLGTDRPLSSFSSRINAAYCLGLIAKAIYDDLHLIRKIRNKFAHKLHGYTFDEPEIVQWCKSIKQAKMLTDASPNIPNTHQVMFIVGVAQLSNYIGLETLKVVGLPRRTVPKGPKLLLPIIRPKSSTDEGKPAH
jgi:DNA-binding MltR family transcriptional regulator